MSVTLEALNRALPLLKAEQAELHEHVEILEVAEPAQLLELALNPKTGRYLLGRLSDTVALIDSARAEDLVKALRSAGHTPKVVEGLK